MKDPAIQARDFHETYGNLVAVDGISFDVRETHRNGCWQCWVTCGADGTVR